MRCLAPTSVFVLLFLLGLLACHGGPSPMGESVSESPDAAAFADLPAKTIAASSDGPDSSDVATSLEAHLAQREYWASETDEGLQAPNRAHDLRSYFDARGVRVEDRDAAERTPLVELSLASLGRAGSLADVPPGEVVHRGEGRTEIVRESLGLVEWFENSSVGLEQGFTLDEKPGPGATVEDGLVLELAVSGARASLSGDSVRLATTAGRLLDYGKLAVFDANELPLAARFEVAGEDRIRIRVDDRDATYPIVVDPLISNLSDGGAFSVQVGALLGSSVASAGDVNGDGFDDVIVGAPGFDNGQTDEGMAFLFLGSPSGIGSGAETTADAAIESDQTGAALGRSVASAGDVNGDGFSDVVIGAPLYDIPDPLFRIDQGAAFLFLGSASGVPSGGPATANARVEGNQGTFDSFLVPGPQLGASVASAGDVNGDGRSDVLIGAPRYSSGHEFEGAAFLYLGTATGIANGTPTTANARFESDQQVGCAGFVAFELCAEFGLSVASAGDVNADGYADILIGAPGYNKVETDEGAAFLWLGSATGIANGNPANAHATFESNQGFVSFGDGGAALGQSVSSAGDLNGDGYADIVIGAPGYDVENQREGSAFVFLGSATGIASGTPATAHVHLERDFAAQAQMGQSVASAGDINGDGYGDILVGGEDTNRVLVYFGSAAGLPNAGSVGPNVQLASQLTGQRYGSAVASAGDVNGDGFDDVLVGARADGAGGQAFVYHGGHAAPVVKANGLFFTGPLDALVFPRSLPFAEPAVRVASAGDVNGDGFGDVVVGVPDYDNGETDEGAAFVYLGSSAGWLVGDSSTAHARFESDQAGAQFGERVASAGDVNGDGFADLIVGAPLYDAPETDEGAAFVFLGSATGFTNGNPATAHARIESNQAGAQLGRVAPAGDVNGDGYLDIVVGAPLYDSPELDEGAAFVFLGSAGGLPNGNPTTAHARFESNLASSRLGWSAKSAGDVNGDGFDDLVVGAPYYPAIFSQGGGAFVFHGSASGLTSGHPGTATSRIQSTQANALLGYSVDSAGDFNGDGLADVVIGAPTIPAFVAAEQGNAYVFVGSPTGIGERSPANADWTLVGTHPNPSFFAYRFGQDVAGAGDLDNDGFGDVVASSVILFPPFNFNRFTLVHRGAPIGSLLPTRASRYIIGEGLDVGSAPTADANASAAGDVNGDGIGDLIVGGGVYNVDRAANVYYGNGRGRFVGLRQLRSTGGGGTLPLGGSANATDRFSFSRDVTSPRGLERARIEIELCAAGLPFGHPSCIRPVPVPFWLDLGLEGFSSTGGILGLVPNQRYSWRARAQYVPFSATQPGIVPIVKNGPWFRVQGRATPGDFWTLPEPGMGVGIAAGLLSISFMGRSRRHSPSNRKRIPGPTSGYRTYVRW